MRGVEGIEEVAPIARDQQGFPRSGSGDGGVKGLETRIQCRKQGGGVGFVGTALEEGAKVYVTLDALVA
jgi:hypothetical protein